jgi:hypothetical protein
MAMDLTKLPISDFQLPITDQLAVRVPIGNRQLEIGNV